MRMTATMGTTTSRGDSLDDALRHDAPFPGLHRGDLIAMTRKNVSAWRNHIRKPTEARIVLASPSHLGLDCASRSPQCVGITPP